MKDQTFQRRLLSFLLAAGMVMSCFPASVFAQENTGLCSHHIAHTAECGYTQEGALCSFSVNGCEVCTQESLNVADNDTVETLSLDKEALSLTVGESQTLVPTIAPAPSEDPLFLWETSDPNVATVDNGTVTAWAPGNTTITVRYGESLSATCEVTVAAQKVLYAGVNGGFVTSWSAGLGDPAVTIQFYYTNDETYAPLDDEATFSVTDGSGNAATGITMTKEPDKGASCYRFTYDAVGEYQIQASLDGQPIGVVTLSVTNSAPLGLSFGTNENGVIKYYSGIGMGVNATTVWYIYFNGSKLPADAVLTYDTTALTVTSVFNGDAWEIKSHNTGGAYDIKYTVDGQDYTIRVNVNDGTMLPSNLVVKIMENGQAKYYNGIQIPMGESPAFEIYFRQQKVTDPNTQWILQGVTMTYNADSENWTITPTAQGENTIQHPDGNQDEYIRIRSENTQINLDEFQLDPGLYYLIFDNHPIFLPVVGLSYPGSANGPIILADKHGNNCFLTLEDHGENLTVSDGLEVNYVADRNIWQIRPLWADGHTITYEHGSEKYVLTVNASNRGALYAQYKGSSDWVSVLKITEDEPTVVKFGWKNSAGTMIEVVGQVNGSNDMFAITRDMNTQEYTVVVDEPGVNAWATYHYDDYNVYMMEIIAEEAYRLALQKKDSGVPVYDFIGTAGQEIEADILFGLPSEGLSAYTGTLAASAGLELTKDSTTGRYKLKILTAGEHTIACTENGKTYTIRVTGMPQESVGSSGSFFALSGNSSAPVFYAAVTAGNPYHLRFCFGSYGDYEVLDHSQLTLVGDSAELTQDGDMCTLTYKHNGQTLIQCTDDNGVVHNFMVKCFAGLNDLGMAWYSNQSVRASVNLPYKGKTVTVGPAIRIGETMTMWAGNSFNLTEDADFELQEEIVVGAMYAGEGNSVTEPADAKFFKTISNLHMSFLTYRNTTDPTAGQNVQLLTPTTVTWKDLPLQMQKIQGSKGQHFESELLVNFDVTLDGVTNRFYHVTDLNYRSLPTDQVEVDVKDTKVLNTLLSNSYCLLNYLKAQNPEFVYKGGNLTLTLPEHTYDGLIVSQLILPGSTDVLATFTLKGNGTTVPGIYSKGFLHEVRDMNFVANPEVTMPIAGQNVTCGLLVDNTRSGFQSPSGFDLATLRAYHPEFQGLSDAEAQAEFESYNPSVPTTGNSYNIGLVSNCTFTDFEYAMRTDAGGFVQGSHGCTIRHCKYGVFINAQGASTLHTDGRANTIWRDNTFVENWVPVRIVDLPEDLSPYYIRFIDNQLLRNHGDFWVTTGGKYYFQRNYFSGKWNESYTGHWTVGNNDNWLSPKSLRSAVEGARAATIVPDDTIVVTNPCRSAPDSTAGLLIFDTDSQQHTAIFQSDAGNMLVSPDSIGNLTTDIQIPVLDSKGETIGTWTIEGGDDK